MQGRRVCVIRSEGGSTALLTLAAVFGGVLFGLLFLNLSRYVAARGAVDEAARKVARCLSATDAGCRTVQPALVEAVSDWYGYVPELVVDVFAREADYSLELPQEAFSLPVSGFEVRSERHQVTWPEYAVPVRRYVGMLNSYARLRGDIAVRLEVAGNRYRCVFRDAVEVRWGMDFTSPAMYFDDRWCSYRGTAVDQALIASNLGNSVLSCDGEVGSEPALTPALAANAAFYTDADWSNRRCSLRLPGSPQRVSDPAPTEQLWLRLGGTPICDAPDALDEPIPSSPRTTGRATDGAFPVTVERQYLVVEVATCDEQATRQEVTTRLTTGAPGGPGPDLDQVMRYFSPVDQIVGGAFDPLDFDADPRANLNSSFLYPPIDPSTGLPTFIGPSDYNWTYLRWERFANPSEIDSLGPQQAQRTTLERRVCYWKEWEDARASGWTGLNDTPAPPTEVRVPAVSRCAGATRVVPDPSFACENRSSSPASGDLSQCQGWEAARASAVREYSEAQAELSKRRSQQNFELLNTLVDPSQVDVEPEATWSSESVDRAFSFAWSAVDREGEQVSMEYARELQSTQVEIVEPMRVGSSYQGPNLSQWLDEIPRQLGQSSAAPGWQQFVAAVGQVIAAGGFARNPADALKIENLNPYPIAGPAGIGKRGIELPVTVAPGELFDFDLDCSLDSECPVADPLAERDLKSVLIEYAGQRVPQSLVGEEYEINVVVDRNDNYSFLGRYSGAELTALRESLPPCAPVLASCPSLRDVASAQPVLIAKQAAEPPACSSGTFVDCYAVPVGQPQITQVGSTNKNTELAKAQGERELSRIFPGASVAERCQNSGCSEIVIDESSPGAVSVAVTYHLGIDFPFDAILGANSIAVSGTTTESLEQRMVGRVTN